MTTFEEFWREQVTDESGNLDLDKVARELHDYRTVISEVAKAYDELTGGRLSKPNTAAHHVVSEANEAAARYYAWELCDRSDALAWDVNVSLALREVAEEWHEGAWREYQESKAQRARIAAAGSGESP